MSNFDFNFLQQILGVRNGLPLFISGIAAFILWLIVLVRVLQRKDLDPVSKLIWVFVVISLNILGAVIYALLNPFATPSQASLSDDPLVRQTDQDYRRFLKTDPEAMNLSAQERMERFATWRTTQDT